MGRRAGDPGAVTLVTHLARAARAQSLDRDLAAGVPASTSPLHRLHARALAGPAERRRLACAWRRILRAAEGTGRIGQHGLPVCTEQVLAARHDIERLIGHLESAAMVSPAGVAGIRRLLGDGSGPLYHRGAGRALGPELRRLEASLSCRLRPAGRVATG